MTTCSVSQIGDREWWCGTHRRNAEVCSEATDKAAVTVVVTVTYPRGMYGDDIRAVVHDILAEALIGDGVEVTVR